MSSKFKYACILVIMIIALGISQFAFAGDLIVVATKATQKASQDWLSFLESKEIPFKLVTPDSFSSVRDELYLVVLGSPNESKEIKDIAKDALTADELKSAEKEGKMFYKPQAWNVGQKVILFLGPNLQAAIDARIATQEEWYGMFQDWFDINDSAGFHLY